MKDHTTIQARIPSATYRWQFNQHFTLKQAAALADYLHELGISDCYASPLLMARPGSLHGYDVTDHSRFNPEIGTAEDFAAFAEQLKQRGLGLLMDVVPNHMCIAGGDNLWWNDVLENGPSSPYAQFFDIDWQPPKPDLTDKVLLPVLGDQYGRVLENQEIKVAYQQGAFFAHYYDTPLPLTPRSYAYILEPVLASLKTQLDPSHPHVLELESIITALNYLPLRTETDEEKVRERQREKEIVKRRLAALVETSDEVRAILQTSLDDLNGVKGVPPSFDQLEELLANQPYRLSYWRVAADEINYRRFFDINELAAIRVEEPAVFAAVHELIFQLMRQGWVTGLRVDHVDGLLDPEQYCRALQAGCLAALTPLAEAASASASATFHAPQRVETADPAYLVVEKILGQDELLPPGLAVHGTTGYGFLNLLNAVFIDTASQEPFRKLYQRFTGEAINFSDLLYECKQLILQVAMSSELHVLARKLDRISEQHRYSRDFTLHSLQLALSEVIACFPVYRTYLRPDQTEVSAEDRRHIRAAIFAAKRRNPATSPSIFDFIGSLLLLEDPPEINDAQRAERRNFLLRFQQLTGPVMAKGMEDTAFYRFCPLASLNEVGGAPTRFGVTIETFHRKSEQRLAARPHSLSATSTHDTKRGEDVRARLNVLSEMPAKWYRAMRRWQSLNHDRKRPVEEVIAPDANEEYLLYQTLVGTWPFKPMRADAHAAYVGRIEEYLLKALREAKVHTSWINPHEEYERAVREFIHAVLKPEAENRFLKDLIRFQVPIARAGMFNSLSQTLLKITAPGVPDFYQGTEIWNFSLVDPDNRRPVDYAHRQALLASLKTEEKTEAGLLIDRLIRRPEDGRLKLHLTSHALAFRRAHHDLFAFGAYLPLRVTGERGNHVIAFARVSGQQAVIVAAARFFTRLGAGAQLPLGREVWGETAIELNEELSSAEFRDIFTDHSFRLPERTQNAELPVANMFAHWPVAMLERV